MTGGGNKKTPKTLFNYREHFFIPLLKKKESCENKIEEKWHLISSRMNFLASFQVRLPPNGNLMKKPTK